MTKFPLNKGQVQATFWALKSLVFIINRCVQYRLIVFSVFTGWSVFLKRTGTHLGVCSEATPVLSAGIFWSNRRRLQRDDCCRPDRRHSPSLCSVPGQWPLCSSLTYTILTLPPLSGIHSLTLSWTEYMTKTWRSISSLHKKKLFHKPKSLF